MKLVIFLLSIISAAYCSDVEDLDDQTFAPFVNEEPLVLAEFFAPWCGHCKKLAPEYEIAATALKQNDPPVPLVKVDCTANQDTCGKFGVSGYPTLKILRKGEVSEDYNGGRDAKSMISVMKSKAGPAFKDLTTMEQYEKTVTAKDAIVMCLYEGDTVPLVFKSVAEGLSADYKFYATNVPEIIGAVGEANTIVLIRPQHMKNKFEDSKVVFGEPADKAAKAKLESFVKSNVHGLCGHMTAENQAAFKKPRVRAFYNVDYVRNVKGTNYWRNRILKVLKKFDGEYGCGVSTTADFAPELGNFGLDADNEEDVQIVMETGKGRFPMATKFSMDNFEAFLNDFKADKIEAYVKSEPLPEDNSGPVKVLVGKNFNEIVMEEGKNVLVEFYAPWCGHCKSLAPKYDELGEKLESVDNVVIAKMDATANDVPPMFDVTGFPTLYWVSAENKPEKYSGGREVKDFMKYIKGKVPSVKEEL